MQTRSRSLRLDIDDVTTTIDASTAANVLQPRSPASAAPPARGGAVMGASGRLQWRGSRAELEALAEQFAAQVRARAGATSFTLLRRLCCVSCRPARADNLRRSGIEAGFALSFAPGCTPALHGF